MTSIIKLHTISGAMDESPPCFLLQVDDFRILLDCGWDENFDQEFMKELRRYVNQIDAVLLSYPDPLHLGALPYLVGKCGLNCPIYATIPVYKMGQMFMYDLYQSRHNMEEFDLFTLDDVDAAFDKIVQLKYNQSVPMKANILQTLRNNGNVLVTVDTAGRVLELAHMLDQLWRNKESGLLAYSLALLNNVSYNVVEFAKSQIEWMSDKLMRTFEGARNNPFQFKHLQLCHSLAELNRVPNPKVVLASTPDMECGFSRELFLQWCSNQLNSIIITNRTSPGTLARQLMELGGNRTLNLEVKRRVRLEGAELEEYQRKERESKENRQEKSEDVDLSDESEDELDSLSAVAKGKHDLLVKSESKTQTGFFKSNKKQYPMFPFFEEKIKFDEYGEIIRPEDYKMVDSNPETEENKENVEIKEEEVAADITEVPTKCIAMMKTVRVTAQVQFIDFEGRSDGESLQKILSQLRPRRLILVRGLPESIQALVQHCRQWNGARVFAPARGDIVDATTETHIYQVRLTDALVSSLELKKGKDAELAWLDAQIMVRDTSKDIKPMANNENEEEEPVQEEKMEIDQIYTLEPLPINQVVGHQTTFINELKLSDFKQVLNKNNISSEFSGGVLWCCNGAIAVRRHEAGRVILEGCLSEDYYRVRELLYEQYAIV